MLGVTHSGQALAPHRVALVLDGEQGNGGAGKARQVALTELREGLVGSPLQSVIEIVTSSCGEPGHHAWVRGVSQDVHVDLAASTPELIVQSAMVRGSLRVAETVEHVPKQSRKARTVQPIPTKPSIGPEGGIGVVVHLSKTRKKHVNKPKLKINHHDNTSTQILIQTDDDLAKPC
jgi:hypothetical protein